MDGSRFDKVAKAFAGPVSRRTALRAAFVALLVGRRTEAQALAAPPIRCQTVDNCLATEKAVHDECLDRCSDMEGFLSSVCKLQCNWASSDQKAGCRAGGCLDGVCLGGICCQPGEANCHGQCVDAVCPPGSGEVYDPATCRCACPPGTFHCGSGGAAVCFAVKCPSGAEVDPATCRCNCPAGTVPCGDACVDTGTDAANCGGCGTACPSGQTCANGTCGCPAGPCPDGSARDPETCDCNCGGAQCSGACCGGRCADLETDPANCGACGVACPGGRRCKNGTCACPPEHPDLCEGICTNFGRDPFACGGCGPIYRCPKMGPLGLPHCCPGKGIGTGVCTNIWYDGANCGGCGHACPDGESCNDAVCMA
jgi:hypothetical protein